MADILKQKLRAHRKAMDSTMTSKSSNVDESKVDDQEIVQDISLADEEDEVGETLKSQLEQRREKSRRILEQQEKDDSKQHPSRKSSHLTQVKMFSKVLFSVMVLCWLLNIKLDKLKKKLC